MPRPVNALVLPLALAAAVAVLAGCERQRSLNPFASSSPIRTHCRAALDYLIAREAEKVRISVENVAERPRDTATAVTIVYVQGESRRLFTCLYNPDSPNRLVGGSYRGQGLTQAQLDEVNAGAGRR